MLFIPEVPVAEPVPEDEVEPEPEVPVFVSVLVADPEDPLVPELPERVLLRGVLQLASIRAIGNTNNTFFIIKYFLMLNTVIPP